MRREIELAISEIASNMSRQKPAVRVIVEGSPTAVQRIADAIETMIPGFIDWHDHAFSGSNDGQIVVEGAEVNQPACEIYRSTIRRDPFNVTEGA